MRLPSPSHNRAVVSSDAVRMRWPSGENTALQTVPACPRRAASGLPAPSHNRAVLIIRRGEDAAAVGHENTPRQTQPACLCRMASGLPRPSHSRAVVIRRGKDAVSVRRERGAIDRASMSLEGGERLAAAVYNILEDCFRISLFEPPLSLGCLTPR